MIIIKKLTKQYGDNVIFENAHAIIDATDKIALLAQNGKGKTTLIKCLSGEEDYEGSIDASIKFSIMEQEKDFSKIAKTFTKYIDEKTNKVNVLLTDLETQFGDPDIYEDQKKYSRLLHEYELLCKRKVEAIEETKLKRILSNIGFSLDLLDQEIDKLSGGEQTAIRLAECLARNVDLYILDEPTNHLDFRAIKWVAKEIRESNKAFIVVSHDRSFIDGFANKVIEIENRELVTYDANYTDYVKKRTHHREIIQNNFETRTKTRKKLLDSAEEKRKWASLAGNKSMAKTADNLQRRADALDLTNITDDEYKFTVNSGVRTSSRVFEVLDLGKSYGAVNLFSKVNLELMRGDRIVIIGTNGTGKSTFLKMLAGTIEADSGAIISGENMEIGFFEQESRNLPLKKSVMDYFLNYSTLPEAKILGVARRFGFGHDLMKKKLATLSGGQKGKLQLMRILLGNYNVLLLDEPTNHLDLELRESLEQALLEFDGTIIFVSHDRYFVERIATKVLRLSNKELKFI